MHKYYLKYKMQKNRSFIKWKKSNLLFGNSGIVCLSSGFMRISTIRRVCIVLKKRIKVRKSMTRYWVRICFNYIFTKKSANTRMGKGKGSIKSYGCYYHSGSSLVEFFNIRNGLLQKFYQYMRVRCAFKLWAVHYKTGSVSIGKSFFKNISIRQYYYKKKKTFPSIIKNYKYIVFKLLLDERFYDTRKFKYIFRCIENVQIIKKKNVFIGNKWFNNFIFKKIDKKFYKKYKYKKKKFIRLRFIRIIAWAKKKKLFNNNSFYFGFLIKLFFINIRKKILKAGASEALIRHWDYSTLDFSFMRFITLKYARNFKIKLKNFFYLKSRKRRRVFFRKKYLVKKRFLALKRLLKVHNKNYNLEEIDLFFIKKKMP